MYWLNLAMKKFFLSTDRSIKVLSWQGILCKCAWCLFSVRNLMSRVVNVHCEAKCSMAALVSYGDKRSNWGMFFCLSEPPSFPPSPPQSLSSHLDVNAFSGLKQTFWNSQNNSPFRGFTPVTTMVSHTPVVYVNSECVCMYAILPAS